MDLNAIVSPALEGLNPSVVGTVLVSTGSTTAAGGKRTPSYRTVAGVPMRLQPLTYRDLAQVDGLNLNGTKRAIYFPRRVEGIVRPENRGGDLVIVPKATFVGSIAGAVMTAAAPTPGEINVGDLITGAGVTANTKVTALGTGTGLAGTYAVAPSQTVADERLTASTMWLVVIVLEAWPNWCKVAVTLQNEQ